MHIYSTGIDEGNYFVPVSCVVLFLFKKVFKKKKLQKFKASGWEWKAKLS